MQAMSTNILEYDSSYAGNSSNYSDNYDNDAFSKTFSDAMHSYDDSANTAYRNEQGEYRDKDKFYTDDDMDEKDDKASSPYNGAADTYSLFVPQPVRFTQTEIAKLNKSLMADGVSPVALNAISDMGNKAGGASVEELFQSLKQSMKGGKVALDGDEIGHVQDLAMKISPNDPDAIYDAIRNGNSVEAIETLVSAMEGKGISASKEELSSLLKALNVGNDISEGILKKLGGLNSVNLDAQTMEKLLGDAKASLQSKADEYTKAQKSLEENLKPIYNDAKSREETARLGQMREQKEVAHSRILIEDRVVTDAVGDKLNRTAKAGDDEAIAEEKAEKAKGKNVQNVVENPTELTKGTDPKQAFMADKVVDERETKSGKVVGDNTSVGNEESSDDEKKQELEGEHAFGKPSDKDESLGSNQSSKQSTTFNPTNPTVAASQSSANTNIDQNIKSESGERMFSPQADQLRDQVESSMLTMMKNGTRRLEVMLNPLDMGQMTVMLTIKNGEVNATIQTEKPESAALIAQQLDVIRTELENQGFKVEKMDVQTGLNQDARQEWQGEDSHNAKREMDENQQYLEQLRTFRKLNSSDETTLARNMQNTESMAMSKAINAQQGLHIIA